MSEICTSRDAHLKRLHLKIMATQGIGPIRVTIYYQLYDNVCQLIADTQALFSALELGQKRYRFRCDGRLKFFTKNVQKHGLEKKKNKLYKSVLNFRRVTQFRLCMLETQVTVVNRGRVFRCGCGRFCRCGCGCACDCGRGC